MKTVNISYAKTHLSKLLVMVRRGDSITILDRQTPIATIQPIQYGKDASVEWMDDLVRRGVVSTPKCKLDVKAFLKMPKAELKGEKRLVDYVIEDREDRV